MSHKPVSSKMMNSFVENSDNTFSSTVTSFQQSRAAKRSAMLISKQLKPANQSEKDNSCWKCVLKILYGVLGIVLLTALILPSILAYLLAPQSLVNQTTSSELSTYRNNCAGVSPRTLWQMNTTTVIAMNLNTSVCDFPDTPLYFVSISGVANHYCLTGYGAIYLPTTESFQIYAQTTCYGWSATTMLSYAISDGWDVNWIGFYK